jgi:hypothetical protein
VAANGVAAPSGVEQLREIGIAQRAADQLAQSAPCRQPGGGRINRRQRLRQRFGFGFGFGQDTVAGMHHLAAVQTAADLAKNAQPAPLLARYFERPLLAAVEAQEAQLKNAALGARIADRATS